MGDFSINELSALSGLPVRTIRYYLAQGLIPSAGREGPATRYPESTLARLRLIRKLQQLHLPLAEIRRQLAAIPDEEAIELAAAPESPEPASSALDYVRSLLAGQTPAGAPTASVPAVSVPSPAPRPPGAVPPGPLPRLAALTPVTPLDQLQMAAVPSLAEEPMTFDQAPGRSQRQPVGDRSAWERISLGPGIELHVRRPLSRRDNRLVERLIAFARQLQEEEAQ